MSFLKWLIQNNVNIENSKSELFFHEDRYLQVELLPRENLIELEKENKKIDDFAQNHTDGNGFTAVYARGGQKIKTSERKIKVTEFDNVLVNCGFEQVLKVYTGYGPNEFLCKDTKGFKLDSSAIFYDIEDDYIKNIWIDDFRFSKHSKDKDLLVECLNNIGSNWNLVLNDWDLTAVIDLNCKESILRYITED